jgi:hypothetical protein
MQLRSVKLPGLIAAETFQQPKKITVEIARNYSRLLELMLIHFTAAAAVQNASAFTARRVLPLDGHSHQIKRFTSPLGL